MRLGDKVIWKYATVGAVAGIAITLVIIWMYRLAEPNGNLAHYFELYDFEKHFGFTYASPWIESQRKEFSILSNVFVSNAVLGGLIGAAGGCILKRTKQ